MEFNFLVETVREGAAELVVPRLEAFRKVVHEYAPSKAPVFYNPLMKTNRDIAVLAIQSYQRMVNRELTVTEPLAGCGVRGVRFAREVEGIRKIDLNDINPEAFKMARYNIQLNGVADRVSVSNEDANLFLSRYAAPRRRFDCIDLDPFGAPVPYMESAIRAVRDGGFLALTATDLAPLCGIYPRVALRKYGGTPLRTEYCQELALRLLSGCLATAAARHEIGVNFLFSHSAGHYVRVYASVGYGAEKTDRSIKKMGYILHCFACFHRETATGFVPTIRERCSECGSPVKVAGPLWLGRIADKQFCERMIEEAVRRTIEDKKQVIRTLSLIKAESDAPATYYVVDKICDKLNVPIPPLREVVRKLEEKGCRAWPTHFHSRGIKTNAPAKTVIETTLEIVR